MDAEVAETKKLMIKMIQGFARQISQACEFERGMVGMVR